MKNNFTPEVSDSNFTTENLELDLELLLERISDSLVQAKNSNEAPKFLESHIIQASNLLERIPGASELKAKTHKELGRYYKDLEKDYDQALHHYQTALSMENDYHAEGILYYSIGRVYHEQNEYQLALEYYQKGIDIQERTLPENHPNLIDSYFYIAKVYSIGIGYEHYRQGNYAQAIENYQKALEIKEEKLLESDPDIESLYNKIGDIYKYQGKYTLAIGSYQKALTVKLIGEPEKAYHNIGVVYHAQGKYDLALKAHQKALGIMNEKFPHDHPYVADLYNNIGDVYYSQGDNEQALEYYQKSLSIREEKLLEDDPDKAESYTKVGNVYYRQGEYDLALDNYQRALEIKEDELPDHPSIVDFDHPDIADLYDSIGNVYKHQDEYDMALELYKKSLLIKVKILYTYDIAVSHNNIGAIYYKQGKCEQAFEEFQKSLKTWETKLLGPIEIEGYIIDPADVYSGLGFFYESQGKDNLAFKKYKKALDIREEKITNYRPDIATSHHGIAVIYAEQGKYGLALENHKKAFEMYMELLEENYPEIMNLRHIPKAAQETQYKYDIASLYDAQVPQVMKYKYISASHFLKTKLKDKGITNGKQTSCKIEAGKNLNNDKGDDSDGDNSSAGSSSSYPSLLFRSQASSSSTSSSRDNYGKQSDKNNETPPSKGAVLAVIEGIESHGALIHDERLKVQLEHYAKTGMVYDTLAPYVEAAESTYPILFGENAMEGDSKEGQNTCNVVNQGLVDKVIDSITERAVIAYNEKLAAQLQYFAATGDIQTTLHAYLYQQGFKEETQQKAAKEQLHEYAQYQPNVNLTCTLEEVKTPMVEYELPAYIDPVT